MFYRFAPLAVVVALFAGSTRAWGPKTWEQKKSERFFKCLLAIEYADVNGDSRIDHEEYLNLVDKYATLLYDESMGSFPVDILDMYDQLVSESGTPDEGPDGETLIDVFGAGFFDLANVAQPRIDKLHKVCEDLAKGITHHGHETVSPQKLDLEVLLAREQQYGGGSSREEEDEDGH